MRQNKIYAALMSLIFFLMWPGEVDGQGVISAVTEKPTDITKTSAILNGNVVLGGWFSTYVIFFDIRRTGSEEWNEIKAHTVIGGGEKQVRYPLADRLSPGIEYEVRVRARKLFSTNDSGVAGDVISFRTLSEETDAHGTIDIVTGPVINIDPPAGSATVTATVTITQGTQPLGYWVYTAIGWAKDQVWSVLAPQFFDKAGEFHIETDFPNALATGDLYIANVFAIRGGRDDSTPHYKTIPPHAVSVGSIKYFWLSDDAPAIPDNWKVPSLDPPERPTYTAISELENLDEEIKNLVVVTHGYKGGDSEWVGTMVDGINTYLADNELLNWYSYEYNWKEKAQVLSPMKALANAKAEGVSLGKVLVGKNLDHVHLIAHSAGAELIQATSDTIKTFSPNTVVHLTFLDPFVGVFKEGRKNYGKGAEWADHYFVHDSTRGFTEGTLAHAYNVDVTYLDEDADTDMILISKNGEIFHCEVLKSSHGWPHEFYIDSIMSDVESGHGFKMSKEGGNWDLALSSYSAGNNPAHMLGQSNRCFSPYVETDPIISIPIKNDLSSSAKSNTGTINIDDTGLVMTTGSPVWIATIPTINEFIDHIAFGAEFLTLNSDGLLSVYWNNDIVGQVDARTALVGKQDYIFTLDKPTESGVLSFRLDSFSDEAVSIRITEPVLWNSTPDITPFTLNITATNTDMVLLELQGPTDLTYVIQASETLSDWTIVAVIENSNGTISLTDEIHRTERFYRAIVP